MVLRYVLPNGVRVMGPPYTEAEEQDLYRRIDGGGRPWTVLRTTKAPRSAGSEAAATSPGNKPKTPRIFSGGPDHEP